MQLECKYINGLFVPNRSKLEYTVGATYIVTVASPTHKRTTKQNSSFYKYFKLVSDALNKAGVDQRIFFKKEFRIPFNEDTIKHFVWKPYQKALFKTTSTTELKTDQVSQVYDCVNKKISEDWGIHIPFPTKER